MGKKPMEYTICCNVNRQIVNNKRYIIIVIKILQNTNRNLNLRTKKVSANKNAIGIFAIHPNILRTSDELSRSNFFLESMTLTSLKNGSE